MTAPTRPSRSHSQLNNYLHCGHSYYLTKIRRLQERPSVWLPGGKAFHTVTEQFDLTTWQDTEPDELWEVEPWLNQFDEAFGVELDELRLSEPDETRWRTAGRKTKDKPNGEDVTWWRQAGREFVQNYIAWRTANIAVLEITAVESAPGIEVEVTLTLGDVPMRGYVDRLFRDKTTGALLVVDLKTGSRTPDSPLQLALYSVQLEPIVHEPVLWGAFYDARKGLLGDPINLRSWNTENLGHIYKMLDTGIRSNVFLPNISSMCKSCSVREFCVYQGGSEPASK